MWGWIRIVLLIALAVAGPTAGSAPAMAQPSTACAIIGNDGPNTLVGRSGRQVICGLGGDDTLRGGSGADGLYGGGNNDFLGGGSGNDVLSGDSGNDALLGESGDDVLTGGPGLDRFSGGTGFDTATDFVCGSDSHDGSIEAGIPVCPPSAGPTWQDVLPEGICIINNAGVGFACEFGSENAAYAFLNAACDVFSIGFPAPGVADVTCQIFPVRFDGCTLVLATGLLTCPVGVDVTA